jgi:hypothetical protein
MLIAVLSSIADDSVPGPWRAPIHHRRRIRDLRRARCIATPLTSSGVVVFWGLRLLCKILDARSSVDAPVERPKLPFVRPQRWLGQGSITAKPCQLVGAP